MSWAYLGLILGVSLGYLRHTLGVSWEYFGCIFGVSWPYFVNILGMFLAYLGHIWGVSWACFVRIVSKSLVYLGLNYFIAALAISDFCPTPRTPSSLPWDKLLDPSGGAVLRTPSVLAGKRLHQGP